VPAGVYDPETVSALAAPPASTAPSRRQRAGRVVAAALRSGALAAVVATLAWLVAGAIAGTAFLVLVAATIVVAGITLLSDRVIPTSWWIALLAAWAVVMLERWAVGGHGGVWVAAAAWLGVFAGARSAGINRWALPLLAYPLISVGIVIAADQPLLHPWGVSWLWIAAVLGPVLGMRVLLDPSPRDHGVRR
jgi:hypothetical protein